MSCLIVSLEDVKAYLRVDYTDEDAVICAMIVAAEGLCQRIARLSEEAWNQIATSESDRRRDILRIAVLYAVAYLFEHREEADYHELNLTLRNLLFAIREGL